VSVWANWRLAIPVLSERFSVVASDSVGFGFTERPANLNYNMENWLRHGVGVLDALGLGKVGLVGNSFGGALALHLAARYTERISRMVLTGSVGVGLI